MPKNDQDLSAFCRHTVWDLVMFGYVQGMMKALPGVPIEKALAIFAHQYQVKDFNTGSRRKTFTRMLKQLYADQRTKQPEQA